MESFVSIFESLPPFVWGHKIERTRRRTGRRRSRRPCQGRLNTPFWGWAQPSLSKSSSLLSLIVVFASCFVSVSSSTNDVSVGKRSLRTTAVFENVLLFFWKSCCECEWKRLLRFRLLIQIWNLMSRKKLLSCFTTYVGYLYWSARYISWYVGNGIEKGFS